MENFSKAAGKNIVDDLNLQFKSMFIDMDPVKHQVANSPSGVKRPQKPVDSHKEFEFSMSNMGMKDDVYEPAMEVVSADKLFFKGQLLPLKKDPTKLQVVQALPCPKEEASCDKLVPFAQQCANLLNFQFPHERCPPFAKLEDPRKKCASEKGLLMMCDSDDSFTMHCLPQAASSIIKNHAHEEGFAPEFRDGFDFMRLCRLDTVFDLLKSDSRSSSFRSHQSSHWSSGEKDSRNSCSSSRYSNGSCQDSCPQEGDRKAPHVSMLMAKHAVSTENECDMRITDRNADCNKCHIRSGKLPIPTVNSRKWSWKGLFTGLRKASKLWADVEKGDAGQAPPKAGVRKRPVFTFKELPCASTEPASYYQRSIGHDWEWQTKTHRFVSNEASSKTGRPSVRRDDYTEEQQIGTIFCLRSEGRQKGSFNGGAGDCGKREKGKVQGNVWNAKESWNRCVSRVKKGTRLSSASKGQQKQVFSMHLSDKSNALLMGELEYKGDHVYKRMKAKSLSSTPFAKSPVRMPEYTSNNPTHGVANIAPSSSSSMNYVSKKVGFASCPASMRSSPHHSGLLAGMSKATPDLHTAIQGAIAHCKQSQGS